MNKYKVRMWDCAEDDACEIEAISHDHAAVKFAEDRSQKRGDGFVDNDVCVLVREKTSGIVASFTVCGEPTIVFRARLVNARDL